MSDPIRRVVLSSLAVMAGFVASRVLGLIREMVVLHQLGASRDTDALLAANAIPDFLFQVLVGGAVGSAFIPVFAGYVSRGKHKEAWDLTNSVITAAALGVGSIALLAFALARPLVGLLVAGRDPAFQDLVADLTRIMLVAPVLFAVSGFAMSVLESYQRFLLAALAPVAYNLAIIAAALLLYQPFGVYGVATGFSLGAALHLGVQVPSLVSRGWRYRFSLSIRHQGVQEVARLMAPRMVGLGVTQLNQLAVVVLASFLAEGTLVYLKVAWLLVLAPLVLAMSVSRAVFPTLAQESARENDHEMARIFSFSLRTIVYLTIPAAVVLALFGEPLIRLFFQRGSFTPDATERTAHALALYSVGMLGHSITEISVRAFYALKDTRTPVMVSSAAILLNVVLSISLMQSMSFGGLALAGSTAGLAEAILLLYLLTRRLPQLRSGDVVEHVLTTVRPSVVAAGLMALVLLLLRHELSPLLEAQSTVHQALGSAVVLSVAGTLYFVVSAALRAPEPYQLVRVITKSSR